MTLCYTDTDSLIYDIETDNFYKDIPDDVESRFDTSDYIPERPLPVGKNKKVIGQMKDELGGGIMKEFVTLRPKMYAYKVASSESKKFMVFLTTHFLIPLYQEMRGQENHKLRGL